MAAAEIIVEQLAHAEGLTLPLRATTGSAGFDLIAAVAPEMPLQLPPAARALVPTGLQFMMPDNIEAQIRPRSGLALRHGVTLLNAPGTIDSDYRGEIGVILINHGDQTFIIERGLRIAQVIFSQIADVEIKTGVVDATARGEGGFGSTGIS